MEPKVRFETRMHLEVKLCLNYYVLLNSKAQIAFSWSFVSLENRWNKYIIKQQKYLRNRT